MRPVFGRRKRLAAAATEARYDAFLSYSRAADERLAAALHTALQHFGKPWYRLRLLRVFRDDASLSANPGLWSSISRALAASSWFVLLASPEAASSAWVGREVEQWVKAGRADRLLLVLTGGEARWRDDDFDETAAIPAALRGALHEEPRYVDMTWARNGGELSLRNPAFREVVANLAAPIQGRDKDELIGEHVRQHRRAVRLARAAVATLTVLTVAAIVLAVLAVRSRNQANAQARIATSRALAAESEASLLGGRLDLGLLLGAQAYRTSPTPEARSALATSRSPPRSDARSQTAKQNPESASHPPKTSPPFSASTPTPYSEPYACSATKGYSSSDEATASLSPAHPSEAPSSHAPETSSASPANTATGSTNSSRSSKTSARLTTTTAEACRRPNATMPERALA